MDNKKTGKETNDHVRFFWRDDWLSRLFLEVEISDVTNGVSMSILLMFLSGIFFSFSLFSHSDSYVDIYNDIIIMG